ncbi:MAG TPA: DUF3311 domain-containing protein [Rhizomicrobium sp.]|nr:DUF3311 domain-containing protein [Rhizomicrobium sp.]
MRPFLRYTIGIAVPFLSVIPTVPLLGRLDIAPFGVPLALLWLFACIPLTSLCLAICWFGHDRRQPDEIIEADYDAGRHP